MLAVNDITKLGEQVFECLEAPAVFEVLVDQFSREFGVGEALAASVLLACYSYLCASEDSFRDFLVDWIEDVI